MAQEQEGIKAGFSVKSLIDNGWVINQDDPIFVLEKPIENRNPINDNPEDTGIKLVVHRMNNSHTFAVLFPNGAMLNFVADSIEQLNDFEKKILYYDCEY